MTDVSTIQNASRRFLAKAKSAAGEVVWRTADEAIDEQTNDWEPYVKEIAKLTDATIEDMYPYPDYPPGTVF